MKKKKQCRNCKYWQKTNDSYGFCSLFEYCLDKKVSTRAMAFNAIPEKREGSVLVTKSSFACIEHQDKKEPHSQNLPCNPSETCDRCLFWQGFENASTGICELTMWGIEEEFMFISSSKGMNKIHSSKNSALLTFANFSCNQFIKINALEEALTLLKKAMNGEEI